MKYLIITWALGIGLMVPLQAIINARLSSLVGGSTQAALISFTGGFLIFALIGLFNYGNLPSLSKIVSLPPYLLSGGIIGSIFVLSAIIIVPKLGSTGWTALIVTGQLLASLIMDHYGLFGLAQKMINFQRVLGATLLLAGSALIINF
ncbi:DMT family transporter [Bacteriovorax sp. Seq25_V]|uniref:DMT family transporter n=1 Tax=Bacteriovorax sp. Seq25_V TaxID=1201288 RepID=UPI000389FB71|nr:DMT family transporter [Bacteriovorax sp. Seq25_V]EQC43678.1 PF04657 family protein [Bacteriovorax sp. Seq25_V]